MKTEKFWAYGLREIIKRFGFGISWWQMSLGGTVCVLEYKIASEVLEAEQY